MPNPTPRKLTHDGLTLTLKEWSKRTGLHRETIRTRIDHLKMSVADALTTPADVKFRPKKKSGLVPRACPRIKLHAASGRACARWRTPGREHCVYFGGWGTPEAATAYQRFALQWAAGCVEEPTPGDRPFNVAQLSVRYIEHVERYYRKEGKPTSEVAGQRVAMKFLVRLLGETPVAEVKGRDLKALQQAMLSHGLARTSINQHSWRITRCFRWGVGEDLVPPAVADVLESVPNLQAGRSEATDPEPVMSVPLADVEATLPHLHDDAGRRAVLTAMVRFALAVGCRPGELCAMTAAAVDRGGPVWCYRVGAHKNVHRQARRRPKLVWIGPKAQSVLAPHLDNPGPGGRVWVFPPKGKGTARTAVSRAAFAEYVRLACDRAQVTPWHPHQLRHNRATEVAHLYESDAHAAAIIGDTPQVAAAVYVDPSEALARRIALATG